MSAQCVPKCVSKCASNTQSPLQHRIIAAVTSLEGDILLQRDRQRFRWVAISRVSGCVDLPVNFTFGEMLRLLDKINVHDAPDDALDDAPPADKYRVELFKIHGQICRGYLIIKRLDGTRWRDQ